MEIILICCHGKERGCSLDLKRGGREDFGDDDGKEEGRRRRRRHRRRGDEDGREHRSLVVRNDEQGGGENESRPLGGTCCPLSSPWWAMMIFGVEALGLDLMMFLSLPRSLLFLPLSNLLLQIQKRFFYFYGRQERFL